MLNKIGNGGLTIEHINKGYEIAIASIEYRNGVHYWEVQINQFSNDIMIGEHS